MSRINIPGHYPCDQMATQLSGLVSAADTTTLSGLVTAALGNAGGSFDGTSDLQAIETAVASVQAAVDAIGTNVTRLLGDRAKVEAEFDGTMDPAQVIHEIQRLAMFVH